MCLLYCDSFLPYGRFYNRLEGNDALLVSYFYIFIYLIFPLNKIFLRLIDSVLIELVMLVERLRRQLPELSGDESNK